MRNKHDQEAGKADKAAIMEVPGGQFAQFRSRAAVAAGLEPGITQTAPDFRLASLPGNYAKISFAASCLTDNIEMHGSGQSVGEAGRPGFHPQAAPAEIPANAVHFH
ncbi:hypothetical protein [Mesorhizobium sp. IMUNJ 23232]|uniref:hypothetical protein n=1 Tax=Mesorhizobium sp. IMUNJ 23232 TaxID=3376064 RepID=UPI00379BBC05